MIRVDTVAEARRVAELLRQRQPTVMVDGEYADDERVPCVANGGETTQGVTAQDDGGDVRGK